MLHFFSWTLSSFERAVANSIMLRVDVASMGGAERDTSKSWRVGSKAGVSSVGPAFIMRMMIRSTAMPYIPKGHRVSHTYTTDLFDWQGRTHLELYHHRAKDIRRVDVRTIHRHEDRRDDGVRHRRLDDDRPHSGPLPEHLARYVDNAIAEQGAEDEVQAAGEGHGDGPAPEARHDPLALGALRVAGCVGDLREVPAW